MATRLDDLLDRKFRFKPRIAGRRGHDNQLVAQAIGSGPVIAATWSRLSCLLARPY
jgi:hypothetical protein